MKKAVVTGANGFIGTALCKELASQGVKVIAVVRNEKEDVSVISGISGLKIVYSDISRFRYLSQCICDRDIDVLFHLAWVGSAGPLRGDVDIQLKNVRYACDTVFACAEMKCRRMVFASSIMEYEISAVMETDVTPGINTLYSSAKIAADYMSRTIAGSLNVEYIRAVISNIYGPGEVSPRFINTSLRKLLSGEHCSFSAGEQIYDFIYIDDAVKAFYAIGNCGRPDRTYYIGSQNPRPLKEFIYEMRDQVDPNIDIGIGEIQFNGSFLSYNEFDIHSVKKDTGFVPTVSFAEGIQNTIAWMKKEI